MPMNHVIHLIRKNFLKTANYMSAQHVRFHGKKFYGAGPQRLPQISLPTYKSVSLDLWEYLFIYGRAQILT
jgi:hypothetical protein